MDWQTSLITILGSGLFVTIINGLMNYKTQIISIKESGLYTKRAEVLDEMMERMEKLHVSMGKLVSFYQDDGSNEAEKERRKYAGDTFNYFIDYYRIKRHYLPKEISGRIDNLCKEYKDLFLKFSHEVRDEEKPDIKKWGDLIKKHQGELEEKQEQVANEFRKIIGVK